MNELSYFNSAIKKALLNIHTGYLAKVLKVDGNTARLQPLNTYKAVGGTTQQASTTSAVIPNNIKCKEKTITYMVSNVSSETTTVLVPDTLSIGDIVYVGVCDRDITNAKNGKIGEVTTRHHNINDGVILRVVR